MRGSWDLVTTYGWAHNPTYSLPNWPHVGCPSCKYGYLQLKKEDNDTWRLLGLRFPLNGSFKEDMAPYKGYVGLFWSTWRLVGLSNYV